MERKLSLLLGLVTGMIFMLLPLNRYVFENAHGILSSFFHLFGFAIVVIFGFVLVIDAFRHIK